MAEDIQTNASDFDHLLADYIELLEAGASSRAGESLNRHPDVADSLREFALATTNCWAYRKNPS